MRKIQEIFAELSSTSNIVITMHQKPDADAMGSSLGLKAVLEKLGNNVKVISPTNWPGFLNWLPGCSQVIDFESKREFSSSHVSDADFIFCLDYNNLNRIKNLESPIRASKARRILIDHHQEPDIDSFDFGISDISKGSTAEMVFDFIHESGNQALIDQDVANCLYAGVMTDTGSFRFPSTTGSAHRMVAELMSTGFDHFSVHEKLFDTFLENRLRFFGHVLLNRMDVNYEMNTALIAIPKSDLLKFDIKTGDTEGLVNYPLSMLGIKMAAIVIDRDEERKWSFRSKGNVDVNTFARQYFNGGGHKNASGGRSTLSLEECVVYFNKVLPALANELAADYSLGDR